MHYGVVAGTPTIAPLAACILAVHSDIVDKPQRGAHVGIFKSRKGTSPWQRSEASAEDPRPVDGRIESAIDRAMREGQFDSLPGKGKPLDDEYLKSGPDFLMQKILKEQGFVPEWARLLRALDHLDEALVALREAGSDDDTRRLRRTLAHFRNDLVRTLNGRVPSPALQRGLRDPDRDP